MKINDCDFSSREEYYKQLISRMHGRAKPCEADKTESIAICIGHESPQDANLTPLAETS